MSLDLTLGSPLPMPSTVEMYAAKRKAAARSRSSVMFLSWWPYLSSVNAAMAPASTALSAETASVSLTGHGRLMRPSPSMEQKLTFLA